MSGLLERCELAETVAYLRSQGITVSIDSHGNATFMGTHDGMSARAVAAIETVRGREKALRLVLTADIDLDARRALEHERESLKRMREGGLLGPRVRWGKAEKKPKAAAPGRRPGSRKAVCARGHDLTDSANVRRDVNGWVRTCLACRRFLRRERDREKRNHLSAPTVAAPEGVEKIAAGSSAIIPSPAPIFSQEAER